LIAILLAAAAMQPPAAGWQADDRSVAWRAAEGAPPFLRIRCRSGGLELFGPAAPDAMPSVPTRVTFRHGDDHVTLVAVPVDTDDGLVFSVPVRASELPIVTLLAGNALTIGQGDQSVDVPGAGAPAVLAPLVQACRR